MAGAAAAIALERCSKWYGDVLGLSDVTWQGSGRIVGLLGPNGAGKSTLIKLLVGLLRPSRGTVRVHGAPPAESAEARRRIGYCPEHDGLYDELTALEFVTAMAELAGVERRGAGAAAERALADMGLTDAQDRALRGFSKGMRQRTKLAQALVHDPDVVLLDEPLTGVDPLARSQILARVRALGAAGKTILVSSHVLAEIEALTDEILVIHRGQVLAEGNVGDIRGLIDRHPHRIRVECDRPRELARAIADAEHVSRLSFEEGAIEIETRAPDRCYERVAQVICETGLRVEAMTSPDNSLAAVFAYLTAHGGGARREEGRA
jgi:ABC-2 type transport system ATP-binding protein